MQVRQQKIGEKGSQFIAPQAMIQGLIYSLSNPCDCENQQAQCECEQQQLNEEITGLQHEIGNIRSQIVQVEQLLHVRDGLYGQLDQLRQERDQIQNQIESCNSYQYTETTKYSGYKEMNQRLRRRIYQVREYIQKMTFENQKIQEGIISHQYQQHQEDIIYRKREAQTNYPAYEGKRFYMTNLQNMIGKIHQKQEDAWRRVKRQEEDIDRRNKQTRMRRSNMQTTFYSPKSRTYYGPKREIY